MPELLVVMPARNSATTIESAVRSTLSAMPKDSTLGVWSDGSTDDTLKVLESIKDARLQVWHASESHGAARARQSILERVDSRLVAAMDSDDITLPWRFRQQRRELRTADLVFGSVVKFRSVLRARPSVSLAMTPADSAMSLLMVNLLNQSTLMARRSVLDDLGGYRVMRYAEDYDLWLRAASHGYRIRQSSLPIACYRVRDDQNSRQPEYLPYVRQAPDLRASYMELLHALTTERLFGFSPSPIAVPDPFEDPEPLRAWIEANISHTSRAFALRYRYQLRHRGPSWRHPDWVRS